LNKAKILLNSISSVAQVVIVGGIYFLLYHYLVKNIGTKQLGVWSLVLATSSIANLANFGITSGLVKFVAEYKANKRDSELPSLLTTSFLTIFVFFVFLVAILYLIAFYILKMFIEVKYLTLALEILPFSLLSLFLNGISGVFTSLLEGLQKNYLRNIIYSIAAIILYFFTVLFLPRHGLIGVAYAQVAQSLIILLFSLLICIRYFIKNNLLIFRWKRFIFKEIMSYGLKFQVVSICQMLYEPTTKAILSKFGGLGMVGYYEMSSRLVSQIRALIVNANQVMIPVVTEANYIDSSNIEYIYKKTFTITILISIPIILGIIMLSPIISVYWIGGFSVQFIIFTTILAIGNLFNIVCGPSYFGFLGQGILNPLIYVHVFMAFTNAILAYLFGFFLNGYGVVLAWSGTLSFFSVYLIYLYGNINKFHILKNLDAKFILYSISLFLIFLIVFFNAKQLLIQDRIFFTLGIELFLYTLVFASFFYNNNEIRKVISIVFKKNKDEHKRLF
jgi:O-antigen/teichoic acid export membrane protein